MSGIGIAGLWLFLAVVVVVSIVVAAGSVWLAPRVLPRSVGKEHNPAVSPFLTVVGLVFGALLGFTVVVAWEQFSSAEAHVASEASTLSTMYRQTVGMPVPEQAQMRALLRKYTMAVEGPEWDRENTGGTTDTARAALTEMYRILGSQPPSVASTPINQAFLGQLTALTSARNNRVLDALPKIPGILWSGLLFGGVLLVALTGFVRLESRVGHVVLSSSVAVLLGLLLFIVFWLDHPFGTQLGVTSVPFERALSVFDAVDRGT